MTNKEIFEAARAAKYARTANDSTSPYTTAHRGTVSNYKVSNSVDHGVADKVAEMQARYEARQAAK